MFITQEGRKPVGRLVFRDVSRALGDGSVSRIVANDTEVSASVYFTGVTQSNTLV